MDASSSRRSSATTSTSAGPTGRNVNHRVLSLERTAQHCAISAHTVERIVLPTVTTDDQRAPALRWGDPRTMAVLSALSGFAFSA